VSPDDRPFRRAHSDAPGRAVPPAGRRAAQQRRHHGQATGGEEAARKTSFLLAIAFGVVTVVSVFIIWSVLAAAGVWDSVNQAVQDVVGGEDASSWDVEKYVGLSRV
jgi:hypothetical protein